MADEYTRDPPSDAHGTVQGACLCRGVRFELDLPTRFLTHCHCDQCRRAHGAGSVTWTGVLDAHFRWLAGTELVRRFDTETGGTRSFCSRCGSTIAFQSPRWAGEVHVAVALIEEPLDREPQAHFYADRAPEWYPIHDDLPRFGGPEGNLKL